MWMIWCIQPVEILGKYMKLTALIIAIFYTSLSLASHSLSEAKKMVKLGAVDTSSIIIKYNDLNNKSLFSFWNFKSSNGFKEKQLFQNLIGNGNKSTPATEGLKGFSEVRFKKALSKKEAINILKDLYSQSNVEYAIFNPKIEEAVIVEKDNTDGDGFDDDDFLSETPDFENLQYHLNAAPEGVDARFAWTIPGGTGKSVRIIDMETGVNADHEDFNKFFFLSDLPRGKVDHGTAVAGEMIAKRDGKGVTGISYDADYGFYSRLVDNENTWGEIGCDDNDDSCTEQEENPYHKGVAANLAKVVAELEAGDLIVLEMHSPGPRGDYIPTEYWNPIYRILKFATEEKGIHCVAAAGNGYQDLDHEEYNKAFDLNHRDSGCVIVGAALSEGEDRHVKANFSNYGSRVDAFGYGRGVVTSGYGDLHKGDGGKYTATFSGTSSATPIVGGSMATLLGIAKERGISLEPARLRKALRNTGTKQKNPDGQRIGNLPDLKAAYEFLFEK